MGTNYTGEGFRNVCAMLRGLSENELRLVVNEYDSLFRMQAEYPSLRSAIEGEVLGFLWWDSDNSICQDELLEKLNQIGA